MNAKPFKPAWWLPGPHLQTLWQRFHDRGPKVVLRRERIELPDGDFVDLDWTKETSGPIVLILHGLEGSVNSPYAQGLLKAISAQGFRGGVVHFRGCSGEVNRLPRTYHSGDTGDIAVVMEQLRAREPTTPIILIGVSAGGNVLLKWLGETGDKQTITAAIAISVPFELGKLVDHLNKGFSRVYGQHLLRCLQDKIAFKFSVQPAPFYIPTIYGIRSLREFDEKITAPLHGFSSADDFYNKSSSRQFLKKIAVPTLILHAADDPFMTEEVIPTQEELSPMVELEVSPRGGHVGFVSGCFPWKPEYWLDQRVTAFLVSHLKM